MREHEADYTFEVGHRLHAGFFIPASHYIRALKLRGQYLRAFAKAAFAQADLILTPVLAIPVPTIAETTGRTGKAYLDMVVAITRNTKVINYLGLPAIERAVRLHLERAADILPADRPAAPGGRPAARRGPLSAGHGLAPARTEDDLKKRCNQSAGTGVD